MDDERIVELFLDRNEDAIKLTTQKYGKQLRRIALVITADQQTAEECENDTYLKAWNSIPPNEPRSYLFQYLSRIVRNLAINRCVENTRLKRNAVIVELSQEIQQCIPSNDDVESSLDGKILAEIISKFLKGLSKEKRLVFMNRYYYLESIESIAKRFGLSKSKVKTMLFRIRNDLREYLIKEGYTL